MYFQSVKMSALRANINRHIIFYRVGKTEIEVARILHCRMDVTRHVGVPW
jgi:plasmid stabilization system protein ParE